MAVEVERARKPVRKLRKALKQLGKDPTAEEVHKLRTETARLEAVISAVGAGKAKLRRKLLNLVLPIRRAAGDVRDMDVLVERSLGLPAGVDEDCRVRLLEHLGERRLEGADALYGKIKRSRKTARRALKRCDRRLSGRLEEAGRPERQQAAADTGAVVLKLSGELARWPALTEENVHDFRKKVKGLRYTLELAEKPDEKLLETLGEVKDRIGEWHDLQVLAGIAAEVLGHGLKCPLFGTIHRAERKALREALKATNAFRAKYLRGAAEGKDGLLAGPTVRVRVDTPLLSSDSLWKSSRERG